MDTKAQIRTYFAKNILYSDSFEYSDDASFLDEGIIDSSTTLELVLFVEETFGISVPDREIIPDHFDSVNKLADYTCRKLAQQNSQPLLDL
jgi:acyl carrier protein